MRRPALLATAVFLTLSACGGTSGERQNPNVSENPGTDPGQSPGTPSQSPAPDDRQQLVGTYETTGSMTVTVDGTPKTSNVRETLVLTAAPAVQDLTVRIDSLDCELPGTMSGKQSFILHGKSCPLNPPPPGCTSSLEFSEGHGDKDSQGILSTYFKGQLVVRCGSQTGSRPLEISLSSASPGSQGHSPRSQARSLERSLQDP